MGAVLMIRLKFLDRVLGLRYNRDQNISRSQYRKFSQIAKDLDRT